MFEHNTDFFDVSFLFLMIKNVLLEGECHSIEAIVALVFCLESAKIAYFNFLIDFCVFF